MGSCAEDIQSAPTMGTQDLRLGRVTLVDIRREPDADGATLKMHAIIERGPALTVSIAPSGRRHAGFLAFGATRLDGMPADAKAAVVLKPCHNQRSHFFLEWVVTGPTCVPVQVDGFEAELPFGRSCA